MAKFKVGDKVRSKDYPDAGVMTITQIGQDVHGTTYRTKWENGSVPSQVFYDSTLVAANSAVSNALAWRARNARQENSVRVVNAVATNVWTCVFLIDTDKGFFRQSGNPNFTKTSRTATVYRTCDAARIWVEKIKNNPAPEWRINPRIVPIVVRNAITSSNPVVQNALNRKVGNAVVNAVRGNTKLKDIDYWFDDNGYGEDTLARYVAAYKRDRCINFVDRHADTAARDAFYDAMYQLTGIKSKWAINAQDRKAWVGAGAVSNAVATNTIGDCFADAVFHIERAARLVGQKPNSVKSELERAKQLIVGPYGAVRYNPDDRSLKATATRCATAIDKAIANPDVETITAARWACERARAAADGGSPRRTFWSNSAAVTNASRSDEILADFKKFVKAQMSAAIAALETAKRDISSQAETSAKTAKATSSTDEHEIIRDYSGKTAKAIDEAISKLKAAKDNPLIL